MVEITPRLRKRFWDKVELSMGDGCWEWQAATRRGYGILSIGTTSINAHRLSYIIDEGTEPGDFVLHTCDNPPCVNPGHLYEGDPRDNARDWYDRQNAAELFQEDSNPNSKLTIEEVKQIKSELGETPGSELAERYGVHPSTISHIATGRNWENVEP